MKLCLTRENASKYKSLSQKIRVLTESWVSSQIYCPSCGSSINRYANNKPVADFYCQNCNEEFELKSKKSNNFNKVVNGAYATMIRRLQSDRNPNLFLLNYNFDYFKVFNFFVIPKHFFIPDIIEKRKPLSITARRAGWVGCNILLQNVPRTGRIYFIRDGNIQDKKVVQKNWNKTLFLREEKEAKRKSWILDIMSCVDKLNKKEFLLKDVYGFEKELSAKHPKNRHIKDKIRQQLQFLRDRGYLEFVQNGKYKLV